jgi:hypothetical protein
MVIMHWTKRGYSVFVEQGLNRNGRLRADVVAMNLRGHLIITEVKSCKADFTSDSKWPSYRAFADQLYMAWPKDFSQELPKGVGLLIPNTRGHLSAIRNATNVRVEGAVRKELIIRLAWRAGTFSKRNTRRTRIYL